jgi:hypothetical protein
VRLTLDYHTHSKPRAGYAKCIALAGNLLGLALCVVGPLALSLAGVYWESTGIVALGFVLSGICLLFALMFAVTAVELICDLVD